MVKVKVKDGNNRFVTVDVNHKDCPKRSCFYYGRYTHHSAVGMSGVSSRTADGLSCLRRDNHGCPDCHQQAGETIVSEVFTGGQNERVKVLKKRINRTDEPSYFDGRSTYR